MKRTVPLKVVVTARVEGSYVPLSAAKVKVPLFSACLAPSPSSILPWPIVPTTYFRKDSFTPHSSEPSLMSSGFAGASAACAGTVSAVAPRAVAVASAASAARRAVTVIVCSLLEGRET